MDNCEKFDVELEKWSCIAPLKRARQHAAAAAHSNSVFVFGGDSNNRNDYLDDVEQYDIGADTWTILEARLAIARSKLAATYLDGRIYLFGGFNNSQIDASFCSECFDVKLSEFVDSPCLRLANGLRGLAAASVVATTRQV